MFGLKKSLAKVAKHDKIDTERSSPSWTNPFDSDEESESKRTPKPTRKTASPPSLTTPKSSNPFDSDDELESKQTVKPVRKTSSIFNMTTPKSSNPFDSDDELKSKPTPRSSMKLSSEPKTAPKSTSPFDGKELEVKPMPKPTRSSSFEPKATPNLFYGNKLECKSMSMPKPSRKSSSQPKTTPRSSNAFDSGEAEGLSGSSLLSPGSRNKYKDYFRDPEGLENKSTQELESDAVYLAEKTTKAVNGCLKIAEEMRQEGTKTLVNLHLQGEQITRSHNTVVEMDYNLSRGEKLLGSLGGMFSKKWKPKKTHAIIGPVTTGDNLSETRDSHLKQRENLGLNHTPSRWSSTQSAHPEPTNALQKVEIEKAKQDDALTDLSNLLGELKDMAIDMGTEIDRQTKALSYFEEDVDELNSRVKGANRHARRLLGK